MANGPCSCGYVAPSGCTCGWQDSNTIQWNGVAGQVAQRQPVPVVVDREDNLLSCTGSGLYATLPTRFRTPPFARVFRSTTQSISTATLTQAVFDTANSNADSIWNGSGDFNILQSGMYVVTYSVRWSANANGGRHAQLHLDGAPIADDGFEAMSSQDHANSIVAAWPMMAGSVLTMMLYQDSGSTLTTIAANSTTTNERNTLAICYMGDI